MFIFFAEEVARNHPSFSDAEKLAYRSSTLEELIFGWLDQGRKVLVIGATDDAGAKGICVAFEQGPVELGHAFLPMDYIDANYSHVKPVSLAMAESFPDNRNETWFEERDAGYQLTWDSCLCGTVIDRRALLDWSVSYALSYIGEANIRLADDVDWECIMESVVEEDRELEYSQKRLICVSFAFQEDIEEAKRAGKGMAHGWGESYWVVEPACDPAVAKAA